MDKYYFLAYKPPSWATEMSNDCFENFSKQSLVFYSSCNKNIIKKLLNNREPTNIYMKSLFNKIQIKNDFDYKISYYTEYFQKFNKIAPNIGVYTFTPIFYENNYINCHIYNAIGYAFDNNKQPDYLYFKKYNFDKLILINRYINIMEKIIKCAKIKNLNTILLSLFGCGHFAGLYPDGQENFIRYVYIKALDFIYNKYTDINFIIMGGNNFKHLFENYNIEFNNYFFPNIISTIDINNILIVNSWDPHSIAGNGNSSDKSLDGYIGRYSMIGRLSWGRTNKFILNTKNWIKV